MRHDASLSIIEDVKNHKFLMIHHERGINKGCANFPGGKKEEGETMEQCVVRETLEETGLLIEDPREVGYVEFPRFDYYVHIFWSTKYSGELKSHEGEVLAFWQDEDKIPYDQMREADSNFLPDILAGKYVKRRYIYDDNFHIKEIVELP